MERKKAIEVIKKNWPDSSFTMLREALETLIPELAESKNDRIRKSLSAYFVKFKPDDMWDADFSFGDIVAWFERQGNLMKALQISNAKIGELIEKNYYLKEQLEKQSNNMGISEATKQKLEDNLNKALEKETPKSCNEFLDEQGEPKFKAWDWVVRGNTIAQILDIQEQYYVGLDIDGNDFTSSRFLSEDKIHLWTIQDAKEGDVLIDKSGSRECPFIFKETKPSDIKTDILNPLAVLGYCGIGGAGFTKGSGWGDTANCIYYPATKEQRDTLMKAMADAGYEWDAEKKELKNVEEEYKGEDYGIDGLYAAIDILQKTLGEVDGYQSDDGILTHKCAISAVKELSKQKPAWGEEDIELLDNTIKFIEDVVAATPPSLRTYNPTLTGKEIPFLKALKDRVQPKQGWSEEDEKILNLIIARLHSHPNVEVEEYGKDYHWLKSLKQRYTWKPSDEQMGVLLSEVTAWTKGCPKQIVLESLYNDLLKLKS